VTAASSNDESTGRTFVHFKILTEKWQNWKKRNHSFGFESKRFLQVVARDGKGEKQSGSFDWIVFDSTTIKTKPMFNFLAFLVPQRCFCCIFIE
jgi:hypothetical protein